MTESPKCASCQKDIAPGEQKCRECEQPVADESWDFSGLGELLSFFGELAQ